MSHVQATEKPYRRAKISIVHTCETTGERSGRIFNKAVVIVER